MTITFESAPFNTSRRGQRPSTPAGGPPPGAVDADIPAQRSFAAGLRRDLDAVVPGLTLDYNSGAVQGTVNRIKQLKAAMYGRAKPDLLRSGYSWPEHRDTIPRQHDRPGETRLSDIRIQPPDMACGMPGRPGTSSAHRASCPRRHGPAPQDSHAPHHGK